MPNRRSKQAGFTAVELLVGLAMASAIMGIALSSVDRTLARWKTRQAAQEIATTIRSTRSLAVRTHTTQVMAIDGVRGRYTRAPRGAGTSMPTVVDGLPGRIKFAATDTNTAPVTIVYPATNETAVAFNSRGRLLSTSTPGYIYVADQSRGVYSRVVVDLSGAVRVERWDGRWH